MSDIYDEIGNTVQRPEAHTPNVVITDPRWRRGIQYVMAAGGIVLGAAITADLASPHFDVSAWTTPAGAAYTFIAGILGLGVTIPNIPARR